MIQGFHHLALLCADLERCERFYRDVLGLRVLQRWPREDGGPGDRSVWLATGEAPSEPFLALERAGRRPEPREWREAREERDGAVGFHLMALRIAPEARRPWEERLAAAGVEVIHRTRWTLYFRDPEGNRLGLSHHPKDPTEP